MNWGGEGNKWNEFFFPSPFISHINSKTECILWQLNKSFPLPNCFNIAPSPVYIKWMDQFHFVYFLNSWQKLIVWLFREETCGEFYLRELPFSPPMSLENIMSTSTAIPCWRTQNKEQLNWFLEGKKLPFSGKKNSLPDRYTINNLMQTYSKLPKCQGRAPYEGER